MCSTQVSYATGFVEAIRADFGPSALVLRWFIIRRRQFSAILHSSASNIDKRRYIRLMLLCCFELFLAWPLALLVNIYNLKVIGLRPYESWSYVHADWSAVWVFSYNDLDTVLKAALLVPKWMTVQIAFAFFGFFGLSSEVSLEFRCKVCVPF